MIHSKIRIKLESFNHDKLKYAKNKILEILENITLEYYAYIPLPNQKRIYCVLRSPHVDKDSREHFEIRIHKRLMDIYYNPKLDLNMNEVLSKANLPSGVFCKILFLKS